MSIALAMAGIGVLSSIMGNSQANENIYLKQLGINAGMKTGNVNIKGEMSESDRKAGFALSALGGKEQRVLAKQLATRASSNTAGASAAYAYTNIIQQFNIKEGNVITQRDSMKRDLGKQSQRMAQGAQSNWNEAESKRKSAGAMLLEATMAGASAYSAGSSLSTSLGETSWLNDIFK